MPARQPRRHCCQPNCPCRRLCRHRGEARQAPPREILDCLHSGGAAGRRPSRTRTDSRAHSAEAGWAPPTAEEPWQMTWPPSATAAARMPTGVSGRCRPGEQSCTAWAPAMLPAGRCPRRSRAGKTQCWVLSITKPAQGAWCRLHGCQHPLLMAFKHRKCCMARERRKQILQVVSMPHMIHRRVHTNQKYPQRHAPGLRSSQPDRPTLSTSEFSPTYSLARLCQAEADSRKQL